MTEKPDFWLDHPPVWELGLSVQTQSSGVLDTYDVRAAHNLFRSELPKVERHPPVWLMGPDFQHFGPIDPLYRWWFISEEGEHLLQLQENLIARNWRRGKLTPVDPKEYPGYNNTRDMFRSNIESMRALANGNLPDPLACELIYDNFLSLIDTDGIELKAQDIFSPIQFSKNSVIREFTMSWNEEIDQSIPESILRIQSSVHNVSLKDEPSIPVVRLNFSSKAPINSWDDAFRFFDAAHANVRRRFLDLTTEKAHLIWGLK